MWNLVYDFQIRHNSPTENSKTNYNMPLIPIDKYAYYTKDQLQTLMEMALKCYNNVQKIKVALAK